VFAREDAMRIHSIEAKAIDIPLTKNFGGATYSVLKRSTVVTVLRTEGGLVSEVYNGDNRADGPQICRLIQDVLAPAVKGLDIFSVELIAEQLQTFTIANGDRKVLLEAIACIDCAVWDVMGKAVGRTVNQLLGGYRQELPIISIGGYYMEGKTLADIGAEMEMYRRAGMAGCKFKVGGLSPEQDARRVEAARKAAGRDFMLCVDANRGWSAQDAIRFARLIEPLDIAWFEEPCHWYDDAAMMARVRRAIRIPVTAGQSEITSHGVRRLLAADAVDYINVDVSECGGVTDWRRSASMCWSAGVRMAHHEESQIALHLLTAIPHGTYVECFADPERDPVWQRMWANRPPIRDGKMVLGTGTGFGLQLDQAMIERYRVA
jgi:L-alanine-DL-glutamate epimerase-like enolase superfamily enzyme